MKKTFWLLSFVIMSICISCNTVTKETPYLTKNKYGATQLLVDGNPFIMLAGELHNSSSSTKVYAEPIFPKLKQLNLNTVLASAAWQQIEPEEGVFDFSLVDMLIDNAKLNDLKLCLIWFSSWKNGQSSYLPMWVKKDTNRFFRVKQKDNTEIETVSPFCKEVCIADARAFSKLMAHIREYDKDKTVIMIQPENEVGIFQDMDYNQESINAYNAQVPSELLSYMKKNKNQLQPLLYKFWMENGSRTVGTWKEVFGDNVYSKSFFTTWTYSKYIEYVASEGKKEYNLPMFVNAWIVQYDGELPGRYPNGGPISDVMDIYKAGAPSIDVICPDIYLPNFKHITSLYHRADNPLIIPESTQDAGRAFYALAQEDALCFSPFGIDDGVNNKEFSEAYKVLDELLPMITDFQGSDKLFGIIKEGTETDEVIYIDDYILRIHYEDPKLPSYGLIIHPSDDEFIFAGMNYSVKIQSKSKDHISYIGEVWEGKYSNGEWIPCRLLNGDETWHNEVVRVMGRQTVSDEIDKKRNERDPSKPYIYTPNRNVIITTPGILKVSTYNR